jgi:hypothetical protein
MEIGEKRKERGEEVRRERERERERETETQMN